MSLRPKFRFLWRRPASARWLSKTVQASSAQEAVEGLAHHLATRHALRPTQVEVDHYFFRRIGKGEPELGTLLNMSTPFAVVYCNTVWPPGAYPAYPSGNRSVFNPPLANGQPV